MMARLRLLTLASICAGLAAAGGCVSKSKADAQARAAFLAGQQEASARLQRQQTQREVVTIHGMVRQSTLPWTEKMTITSALLAADYYGPEPAQILVVRGGRAVGVPGADLLAGRDVKLLAGDVLQIQVGSDGSIGEPVQPR